MDILRLKKANCKNCYRCIRECPVKAIEFNNHQAQIIKDECLLCGRCVNICPQNAKEARNDTHKVKEFLELNVPVIATVAPSFIVAFRTSGIDDFSEKLKMLGFTDTFETAEGAFLVKSEYEKILKENKNKVVISSCCHSVVKLIEHNYVELMHLLAPVISPMQASAKVIKEKYPDAKIVFIGPCISKKEEAEIYGDVDCVLTFDELKEWFDAENIVFDSNETLESIRYRSRFFPTTGGIIKSMNIENDGYRHIAVDGIERCVSTLNEIANNNLEGYFIEMSLCEGSCINGPAIQKLKKGLLEDMTRIEEYASLNSDFDSGYNNLNKKFIVSNYKKDIPGEKTIKSILAKIGKTKPEHELNCGACGYSSCRAKAIAVYQGKAELEMCLPYMKERAESLSGKIIASTPNAIIALDNHLFIQEINLAAYDLFGLDKDRNYKGEYIASILEPSEYLSVIEEDVVIKDKPIYIERYKKYVEESVVYDKEHLLLIIIMKDITEQEIAKENNKKLQIKTVELADKVITKQMRVAQEIALLLGETTAETKIALTDLKKKFK